MYISACAIYSFELYSCDLTSRGPSHALSSGLYSADPLTDNIYKQILCYSQQSDKQIYHKQTLLFLTSLVGGDAHRHALCCPCTTGLGNPIARMDNESVVRVGPELAHHHPGGGEARLTGREEHIWAAGRAELRAGDGAAARARPGKISRPALEDTSA